MLVSFLQCEKSVCGVGREGAGHGQSKRHYLTAVREPFHQEDTLVSMATHFLHEPKPIDDQTRAIPAHTYIIVCKQCTIDSHQQPMYTLDLVTYSIISNIGATPI